MPQKITPKQESFCLKYVETGNATEAHRHAYNAENMKENVINNKASLALQKGLIGVRIQELQAKHRKKHDITVESLTKEFEQARIVGYKNNQASAMVAASLAKARLHGLMDKNMGIINDDQLSWGPQPITVQYVDVSGDVVINNVVEGTEIKTIDNQPDTVIEPSNE